MCLRYQAHHFFSLPFSASSVAGGVSEDILEAHFDEIKSDDKIEISIFFNYLISDSSAWSHQLWDSYIIYFFISYARSSRAKIWFCASSSMTLCWKFVKSRRQVIRQRRSRSRKSTTRRFPPSRPSSWGPIEMKQETLRSLRFLLAALALKGTLHKSSSIKIDYDTFLFLFRINVGT